MKRVLKENPAIIVGMILVIKWKRKYGFALFVKRYVKHQDNLINMEERFVVVVIVVVG